MHRDEFFNATAIPPYPHLMHFQLLVSLSILCVYSLYTLCLLKIWHHVYLNYDCLSNTVLLCVEATVYCQCLPEILTYLFLSVRHGQVSPCTIKMVDYCSPHTPGFMRLCTHACYAACVYFSGGHSLRQSWQRRRGLRDWQPSSASQRRPLRARRTALKMRSLSYTGDMKHLLQCPI